MRTALPQPQLRTLVFVFRVLLFAAPIVGAEQAGEGEASQATAAAKSRPGDVRRRFLGFFTL